MNDRYNLLLVFSDQHRWSDLGCYGNPEVHTPHFDAFAANGLRLDGHYSNCPLCVPARGSLLTATHALRHRAAANDLPVREDMESLAHVLNRADYQSGYIGKWHLAGVPRNQHVPEAGRLGFKHWKVRQCSHDYLHPEYHDEQGTLHTASGYEPVVQTDLAKAFIEDNAHHPWGLVLSWGPPHDPYDAVPEVYRKSYDTERLTLRPNVPETIYHTPDNPMSRDEILQWQAGYYAHTTALDEQFGRLVESLKRTGQWERTLVVYTSDHGDMMGSQGLTLKQLPYEESAHIPLIIGGGIPGLRRGSCKELTSIVDLSPTLLGALGLSFESEVDGQDLSGLLWDEGAHGQDAVYLYNPIPCHHGVARGDCSWRALRTRHYSYAINLDSGEDWFLYDNETDPFQMTNLLEKPEPGSQETACKLRSQLLELSHQHDGALPWRECISRYGLREIWNESQRFFNLPELPAE